MPYRTRPAPLRDCLDCGTKDGMALQNVAGTPPTNIPLFYICSKCGCTLTVPPKGPPIAPQPE